MERNRTDSTKLCDHIVIESECFLVCVKCAKVQDIICMSFKQDSTLSIDSDTHIIQKKLKEKMDFLKELKSRGLISENVIVDCMKFLKIWQTENTPYQKSHLPYALYLSTQKNGNPLSLKEISFYFQLSVKEICKVEKIVKYSFKLEPRDYITKYCAILDLSFMDEKIIESYLKKNYLSNNRNPAHIAASAIAQCFPSIEKKKIAELAWTTVNTIKKISLDLQTGKFK